MRWMWLLYRWNVYAEYIRNNIKLPWITEPSFQGNALRLFLTHWGRETHICVGKLTIIASDNGLSPGRRQAIIWTNAGILLIGPLGTNINEIVIEIHTFPFKKMHLKMSSAKWRPFCLGLNVLSEKINRCTVEVRAWMIMNSYIWWLV